MHITLVNMPWASIDFPSLALGILKQRVTDEFPDSRVDVVNANLDYLDWITERTGLTRDEYNFCWDSYFTGYSEWIFSSALYDDPQWRNTEFADLVAESVPGDMLNKGRELHALAPEYIESLVSRILADRPDVVGFSTTFAQNSAVLAAARLIKRTAPEVRVVLGGGNCDGPQGAALHRGFPFIDYVNRGEGELSFTRLLSALQGESSPADIPGLCWRDADGTSHANAMSAAPLPASALVTPDYTDYFEQHAASRAGAMAEPHLVVESSRGCWWGQKHHCTFCGLNGSFMEFRSKSPDRFVDELLAMTERYQVLNVAVADNILDMNYLRSMVPRLAEAECDLRISYEIKSNMRREQLASLVAAGIHYVQPGIESLSGRVLKLMDKGVTGCQNVRMMRDAESVSLGVVWNYLFGFPDETEEDYESVIDQFPAIHHLAPPNGVTRIAIERFSPYFNRPELGFGDLRPAAHYAVIYDLPESELRDMAYVFDAAHQGISSTQAERLEKAIETWRHEFPRGRLTQCDLTDSIVLTNTRPGFTWRTRTIEPPWELAAFRLLSQPCASDVLLKKLRADAHDITAEDVSELLARWRTLGLLFEDGGQSVHVVPYAANQDLMRWVTGEGSAALVPALLRGDDPGTPVPESKSVRGPATTLHCWRERDEETRARDGIYMGQERYGDTPVHTVSDLVAQGARHVALPGPVILGHGDDGDGDGDREAVRGLTHVRELTGHGLSVDWELDLGTETGRWRLFSHLYPPRSVAGPDGDAILDQWRATFHMNKCGYRRGTGFVEVTDLRHGKQRRVIMRKANKTKLESLLNGAPASAFRQQEIAAFTKSGLVHQVGSLLWWLPSRITRWPVVG
ncbi:RiPP maturation radical SAM C-methyltransferase [Streptomyces atriruber]|uniref:RiPP maturation radical SAM C-methyltransferase n=1 Tax=Streptomyces atriruber TaxID=545121 RepID=UPI0007C7DD6B|nr:RiPP maturation radical SAM C-methyltransferase [Streptomyces atriruber]